MAEGATTECDTVTLGDPRSVEALLSIVTGRLRQTKAVGAATASGAGKPVVEVLPFGWNAQTLLVERTPSEIRTLCEEGIISPVAPWKRAPA